MRPKESETIRDEEILPSPYTVRTDDTLKVRFSATVGEDPEVEVALL